MTSGRAAATSVVGVLALVLLVIASVWAASVGPSGVLRGEGPARVELSATTPASLPGDGRGEERPLEQGADDGVAGWVRAVALVVEALLALGLLGALAWVLRRAARRLREWWHDRARTRRPTVPELVAFETIDDRAALAGVLRERARPREHALTRGTPRNAIVAAWVDLEESAGAAGVRRAAWQTSAEFVLEVLDASGADPEATLRLSALYREARFSDHVLDEGHREEAARALALVHAGLRGTAPPVGAAATNGSAR